MTELTPYGQILERARGRMSQREAARRAEISDGWWRQVITGHQKQRGILVPANPKRSTLIAMAEAVGADINAVLEAAGFEPEEIGLPDDATVAADQEDAAVIAAAVASLPAPGPATLEDVRDRLDAVIREAVRAQRMLAGLGERG